MEFRAKIIDVEQGRNEIVLNKVRATELGITLLDRVTVSLRGKEAVTAVDYSEKMVHEDEVALFKEVANELGVSNDDVVTVETLQRPHSFDLVKKKLDGDVLKKEEIREIIDDLMKEKLSPTELASFITAIYVRGMTIEETSALAEAICNSGDTLKFKPSEVVVSEHSIGGVAGDKVSMLIVPIIASLGIKMPKTASRSISSASGTADCMEVLTRVTLGIKEIQAAVDKTNGCLVWGGAVRLASADDKLIKIRNPLRLDPKPLLLASILAKKKAEGAKYVVIDIPIGQGAKIESQEEGKSLAADFETIGSYLGMRIKCIISDGSQPSMSHVGPALEAKMVLQTLERGEKNTLSEKACRIAGVIIAMVRGTSNEEGYKLAFEQVRNGRAHKKFLEMIVAQGGDGKVTSDKVEFGKARAIIDSDESGNIAHIDNKAISRLCRMLGAPADKKAGIIIMVAKGQAIEPGTPLLELYSTSREKVAYAKDKYRELRLFEVEKIILDVV